MNFRKNLMILNKNMKIGLLRKKSIMKEVPTSGLTANEALMHACYGERMSSDISNLRPRDDPDRRAAHSRREREARAAGAKLGESKRAGVVEGAAENAAAVQALLDCLIGRGLDLEDRHLFIVDGSQALNEAIRRALGAEHSRPAPAGTEVAQHPRSSAGETSRNRNARLEAGMPVAGVASMVENSPFIAFPLDDSLTRVSAFSRRDYIRSSPTRIRNLQ